MLHSLSQRQQLYHENLISVKCRKIVRKIPSSDDCIVWALKKEVIGTFKYHT